MGSAWRSPATTARPRTGPMHRSVTRPPPLWSAAGLAPISPPRLPPAKRAAKSRPAAPTDGGSEQDACEAATARLPEATTARRIALRAARAAIGAIRVDLVTTTPVPRSAGHVACERALAATRRRDVGTSQCGLGSCGQVSVRSSREAAVVALASRALGASTGVIAMRRCVAAVARVARRRRLRAPAGEGPDGGASP